MPDPIEEHLSQQEKFAQQVQQEVKASNRYLKCLKVFENNDELRGLFKFNEFSGEIEFTKDVGWSRFIKKNSKLEDGHLIELRTFIGKNYYFNFNKNDIYDAVYSVAINNPYHPIKSYLEGLQWDGRTRIDHWLASICGVEYNQYTQDAGRKVLLAAIARVYRPGCKFDFMMILESNQGAGKSTLLEILAGSKFYASISLGQTTKDLVDSMRGKWIMEVKEMQGFHRSEVEKVKAILDTGKDTVRLSYGRLARDFERSSIMVGTMNPQKENKYLIDETGNRRFWPIACSGKIQLDLLVLERDQMWAEALQRYRLEPLYLENPIAEVKAIEEQEARMSHDDPWDIEIAKWIADKERLGAREITVGQIMTECLKIPIERQNKGYSGRVGRSLAKTNWVRLQRTTRTERGYYYVPASVIQGQIENKAQEWTG